MSNIIAAQQIEVHLRIAGIVRVLNATAVYVYTPADRGTREIAPAAAEFALLNVKVNNIDITRLLGDAQHAAIEEHLSNHQ